METDKRRRTTPHFMQLIWHQSGLSFNAPTTHHTRPRLLCYARAQAHAHAYANAHAHLPVPPAKLR